MKNMNMKERYWNIDLQLFSEGEEPEGLNDPLKMVYCSIIPGYISSSS